MSTDALHRKMMAEFLDKIKDWPEDAKRSMKEALDRMLGKPLPKGDPTKGTLSAFGKWEGDGTAEELAKSIRDSRYFREKDLDW